MEHIQCQSCRIPLRLDSSLEALSAASLKILTDAAPIIDPQTPQHPPSAAARERHQLYHEALQSNPGSASRAGSTRRPNPDMSYIMLIESQATLDGADVPTPSPARLSQPPATRSQRAAGDGQTSLSQEMETVMRLFETLSARSDIDHPICSECTELLLDSLHKRQAATAKERDAFALFLKQAQHDLPTEPEQSRAQTALHSAKQREQQALQDLQTLEAEKAQMELALAQLDAETAQLHEEETRFWRDRNAFAHDLTQLKTSRDSLQTQLSNDTHILEALQRTNVYNDTFCIGHDGIFGTINGLRLGRLADHHVDWAEINAAWGQTLLLLSVVTEKLHLTLSGYELVPVGSTSKVVRVDHSQAALAVDGRPKRTILELYSSGDLPLGLGFLHRNFDNAMVAFLECLRQVGEHVERATPRPGTPGLKMPYAIVRDKIGLFLLAHASHVTDARNAAAR